MGEVIKLHHARASAADSRAKSSAVTQLSVAVRKATASSLESQTLPRRSREMVVRSHDAPAPLMRAAIPSSSSPSRAMNSESFIDPNVHQVHNEVNPVCARLGMEVETERVHDMHMARTQRKLRPEKPSPQWRRTFLREWREHTGLSLEDASAEMGLKHSQLSRIERGKQKYCQNVLEAAERIYAASIWQILYAPPDFAPSDLLDAIVRSLKGGKRVVHKAHKSG